MPALERICEGDAQGLVLPLFSAEQDIPRNIRGIIYGVLLVYCFHGVSIIANTFMGAIEAVTSQRRQVVLPNGRLHTTNIWNDTVANLSLMALGSSAPEIMLSCIELLRTRFYAGELGPSTIVGSAAFNLLMIVAVCVVVIPSGEARKIKVLSVFYVTMVFSLFAYGWLVLILTVISPDVVEVWEAVSTLLFLPLLVWLSYLADTGRLNRVFTRPLKIKQQGGATLSLDEYVAKLCSAMGYSDEETVAEVKRIVQTNSAMRSINITSKLELKELEALVTESKQRCKSRAARRMEATRAFTGMRRDPNNPRDSTKDFDKKDIGGICGLNAAGGGGGVGGGCGACTEGDTIIEFLLPEQCMSKDVAQKPIIVTRVGDASQPADVQWSVHLYMEDEDGQRVLLDKEVYFGMLNFKEEERRAVLYVTRPQSLQGSCEDFAVRLRTVEVPGGLSAQIGATNTTNVVVCPANCPGRLVFATEKLEMQGMTERQSAEVMVMRVDGCSGVVSCNYRTEKFTSVPGYDYEEKEGTLEFCNGVTEKVIELVILPKGSFEETDSFFVVLDKGRGGIEFDPTDDGGADSAIFTITILSRASDASLRTRLLRRIDRWLNIDELRRANWDWVDQFPAALYCNGDSEAQREATKMDWVFHILSLPWKLVFTLVPPTGYCGGWICFMASLVFISGVTAVIGDLAELFGCVLDVPHSVTAITFVALGTSMPDLFASQTAAAQDPWADASICNVTGSNSVNVFLGLGLPWTMAALYWGYSDWNEEWADVYKKEILAHNIKSPSFIVPAGSLGFSVSIFCCAALVALVILNLRRRLLAAELGGPWLPKVTCATTFVVLWLTYISTASWEVLRADKASSTEVLAMILVPVASVSICSGITVWVTIKARTWPGGEDNTDGSCEPPADSGGPMGLEVLMSASPPPVENSPPSPGSEDPPALTEVDLGQGDWKPSGQAAPGDAGAGQPAASDADQPTTDVGHVKSSASSATCAGEHGPGNDDQQSAVQLSAVNLTDVVVATDSEKPKPRDAEKQQEIRRKRGPLAPGALVNFPNATREVATFSEHESGRWSPTRKLQQAALANDASLTARDLPGHARSGAIPGVAQTPKPSVVRGGSARMPHSSLNVTKPPASALAATGTPNVSLKL